MFVKTFVLLVPPTCRNTEYNYVCSKTCDIYNRLKVPVDGSSLNSSNLSLSQSNTPRCLNGLVVVIVDTLANSHLANKRNAHIKCNAVPMQRRSSNPKTRRIITSSNLLNLTIIGMTDARSLNIKITQGLVRSSEKYFPSTPSRFSPRVMAVKGKAESTSNAGNISIIVLRRGD